MALIKKYKTPQFGPIGDKAWKKYKEEKAGPLKAQKEKLDEQAAKQHGKVNIKTTGKDSEMMSPYTKTTSTKVPPKQTAPKKYRSLEPTVDYPVYDSNPRTTTTQNTSSDSSSKEVVTGPLTKPSDTDVSSDRMSWAREAERKARKMMGGKD